MTARMTYLDIETSPILAHVWGLRDQFVGINQIIRDPEIIGVGFKRDDTRTHYSSTWDDDGREAMLQLVHGLLDETDFVVHYNGDRFDIPWLNGEFARIGLTPPSPFRNIDLYKVVRKNFRFPSYKLQYVAGALGIGSKLSTGGHELWVDCLNGDPKARRRMARYCKQDVNLLPLMLEKLRPWLPAAINFALFYDGDERLVCRGCAKPDFLRPKGQAHTAQRSYPQYLCCPDRGGCGSWTRDTRSNGATSVAGVAR